jgi:hypothetical protein
MAGGSFGEAVPRYFGGQRHRQRIVSASQVCPFESQESPVAQLACHKKSRPETAGNHNLGLSGNRGITEPDARAKSPRVAGRAGGETQAAKRIPRLGLKAPHLKTCGYTLRAVRSDF